MIRIAAIGQPYWTNRVISILNQIPEVQAFGIAPSCVLHPWNISNVAKADILLRIGMRPAAPTLRGTMFDIVWNVIRLVNKNIPVVYYWLGTDVLNSLQDYRRDRLRGIFHRQACRQLHWADAPWLVSELREIGYTAEFQAVPVDIGNSSVAEMCLPEKFRVLTYIPDKRYVFYGGKEFYQCAQLLPHIEFDVIGGCGTWVSKNLPNLRFHGWQENIRPFIEQSSVLCRLVQHDGLGGTVREALQAARHVIYTQDMPHTHRVTFGDTNQLVEQIKLLFERHENMELTPNDQGMKYVTDVYSMKAARENYNKLCNAALNLRQVPD